MKNISIDDLNKFVNDNIDKFHESKISALQGINLNKILKKKNPYLFKAKNLNSAHALINDILNASLYSSEEELFGRFLEDLAIFISMEACNGTKSASTGIDLEFKDKDIHYIVSIKSGSNWGNSSQQKKQEENFQKAVGVLKQSNHTVNVQPVLGICYGKTRTTFLRGYTKVVGQSFWYLISGNENLYTDIVQPLGYKAKEHNDKFTHEKDRVLNLLTQDFLNGYCVDGDIDWDKLVKFNSGNLNLEPTAATTEEEAREIEESS